MSETCQRHPADVPGSGRVTELGQIAGLVGALGLALVVLAPRRLLRLAGLAAWAVGCGALAVAIAPRGDVRFAAVGLAAPALAWLFVRVPWSLAVAALACVPTRTPVSLDGLRADLPLPLYAVVAAAALALAWQLARGDGRVGELGPLARPLALLVAWIAVSCAWSSDPRAGAMVLLFFVLPFGLLAVAVARLPWSEAWATTLYVQAAAIALALAAVGVWRYLTRDIVWSPSAVVSTARAPSGWYHPVDPGFGDAGLYGRFLVVVAAASLVVTLSRRGRLAALAALAAGGTWLGLLPSFSPATYVAFAAAAAAAVIAAWAPRAALVVALAACFVGGAALTAATVRDAEAARVLGTGSQLASAGVQVALDHAVVGVGAGASAAAYPNAALTLATETGAVGLALLAWLAAAALVAALRGTPSAAQAASAIALVGVLVHSLLHGALLEDPVLWGLLGLVAAAAAPPPPGDAAGRRTRPAYNRADDATGADGARAGAARRNRDRVRAFGAPEARADADHEDAHPEPGVLAGVRLPDPRRADRVRAPDVRTDARRHRRRPR